MQRSVRQFSEPVAQAAFAGGWSRWVKSRQRANAPTRQPGAQAEISIEQRHVCEGPGAAVAHRPMNERGRLANDLSFVPGNVRLLRSAFLNSGRGMSCCRTYRCSRHGSTSCTHSGGNSPLRARLFIDFLVEALGVSRNFVTLNFRNWPERGPTREQGFPLRAKAVFNRRRLNWPTLQTSNPDPLGPAKSKARTSRAAACPCWRPAHRRRPDAAACARSRHDPRR